METKRTKLREVMTEAPYTVERNATLSDAAKRFADHGVGVLPVVESEHSNEPIGVLTDRDLVIRGIAEGRNTDVSSVGDVMTHEVVKCAADASLSDAAEAMKKNKVRRVLITENEKVIGVVSTRDLVKRVDEDGLVADTLEAICS